MFLGWFWLFTLCRVFVDLRVLVLGIWAWWVPVWVGGFLRFVCCGFASLGFLLRFVFGFRSAVSTLGSSCGCFGLGFGYLPVFRVLGFCDFVFLRKLGCLPLYLVFGFALGLGVFVSFLPCLFLCYGWFFWLSFGVGTSCVL